MANLIKKKVRKFFNVFSLYMTSERALTYPVAMQVEIVCGCNINCKMCVLPKITRKKGKMSFQIFKDIYNQIKPDTIVLTGYGETLLNKDVTRMIQYAKANRSSVHMDTNCTVLNEKKAKELISSGIDLIKVSVDAATKNTYDRIRIGSSHKVIWSNLKKLIKLKKEMKSKKPIIDLTCVVQPGNFEEMDKIVEAGYNLDKTNVRFGIITEYGNNEKGTYNLWRGIDKKRVLNSFDSAIKKSAKLGLKETLKTLSKTKGGYVKLMKTKKLRTGPCFWPWSSIFITWQGDVKPCCYFYDQDMVMGNVVSGKFKNTWNNRKYRKFRKNLVRDREIYARCCVCGNDESQLFNRIGRYFKYFPFIESNHKIHQKKSRVD